MIDAIVETMQSLVLSHIFLHMLGQYVDEHRSQVEIGDTGTMCVFDLYPFPNPMLQVLKFIALWEIMEGTNSSKFHLVGATFVSHKV